MERDAKDGELREPLPLGEFSRRAAVVVAMATGAVFLLGLIATALDILLVIFAGVLLAVLLRAISDPLAAKTPLSPGWALVVVIIVLSGLFVVAVVLLGPPAVVQFDALGRRFPEALEQVRDLMDRFEVGQQIVAALDLIEPRETLDRTADVLLHSGRITVHLFTFLFVGFFLAMRPGLYVSGIIRLFPKTRRPGVRDLLFLLGRTLRWFLLGRLASMTMVAVSTILVLWIIGVPLAGLLGILAGLLTFAPYVGPILGGIPIVVVALIESPTLALWALGAYVAVQWVEGYILDPLIQQRMVELPPAVTVSSQVLLGIFAGGIGIAVATPLAAVIMVTVQVLWVRGVIGDPIRAGPRGLGRRNKKELAEPGLEKAESSS